MLLSKASGGASLMERHKRVIVQVSVVGNATPTLVRHSSDAPDAIFLSTEGRDEIVAEDTGATLGTIENNNAGASIMGVLLHGEKLMGRAVQRLYSVSVTEVTSTAGTVTSALKGVSSSGITADGNVAITISGTAANLAADTVTYRIVLECLLSDLN